MRMAGRGVGSVGGLGLAVVLASAAAAAAIWAPMSGQPGCCQGATSATCSSGRQRTLVFTRDTADPSQPEPQDLLVWPLDEPSPSVALGRHRLALPAVVAGVAGRRSVADRHPARTGLRRGQPAVGEPIARLRRSGPAAARPTAGASAPQLYELLATTAMRSDGARAREADAADTPDTIVVGRPPSCRRSRSPTARRVGGVTFVGADLALLVRQETRRRATSSASQRHRRSDGAR